MKRSPGKGPADVKAVLIETTDSIDTAIFLSAITTMAAFISDVFIDVVDIQRLGYLVTLGIAHQPCHDLYLHPGLPRPPAAPQGDEGDVF